MGDTSFNNAGAIQWYHTGAASAGAAQADPDASIGSYYSSNHAKEIGHFLYNPIPGVKVLYVSGVNGEGYGYLFADDTGQLAYKAPSGTKGTAVAIANGNIEVFMDGTDDEKFIIAERTSADDLAGSCIIDIRDIYNNAIGGSDSDENGLDRVRCLAAINEGTTNATNFYVFIKTLGTQYVSDGGQLGAAGTGTIVTTSNFDTGLWPEQGFCRIETNAGVLREIVYYTSRTSTTLTISNAAHRSQLGTTAAAGVNTDKIYPVPGIRIGKQAPTAGQFSQPSSETDVATVTGDGVVWNTGITAGTGLNIGTLAADGQYGLWIRTESPAGATAEPRIENMLEFQFDHSGNNYTGGVLRGNYRYSDSALALYKLYVGQDASPDFTSAPNATSAALPVESTAQAAGHTYHLVTRYENKYGLESQNIFEVEKEIDGGGDEVAVRPQDPVNIELNPAAAGEVNLKADYYNVEDGDTYKATQFLIWLTSDGSNPDPAVDPVHDTVTMSTVERITRLDWTSSGSFGDAATIKVIVRTRRIDAGPVNIDSQGSTIYTTTTDTDGPAVPDPASAHFAETSEYQ